MSQLQTATEPVLIKHLPALGYRIEARRDDFDEWGHPWYVRVEATRGAEREPLLEAAIDRQGCANIQFCECVHLCGVDDAVGLGHVLRAMYQMAADLFGEVAGNRGCFGLPDDGP